MSAGHTNTYTNKLIHLLYCVCAFENSQMLYTHNSIYNVVKPFFFNHERERKFLPHYGRQMWYFNNVQAGWAGTDVMAPVLQPLEAAFILPVFWKYGHFERKVTQILTVSPILSVPAGAAYFGKAPIRPLVFSLTSLGKGGKK